MKKKHSAILLKREEEVARRLSPSWNGQDPKPVLSPDGISYEVSEKIGAVSYGGLGLLQQVVKWSGLGEAIDRAVKLFKRHQPYHESDHVLNLIYNVATGGTRYQDIELRRQSVSFLEAVGAQKIPAPSTAGDFVQRFDASDVVDLMEAVNESRRKVWAQQPRSFFERAEIDVDGTIAPTRGEGKKRRQRRAKVKPEIVKTRGFKKLTLEREEIAEMDYHPSKAQGTYRLVVLRKTILVEKGQRRLLPQTRYHFYVTNIPAAQLGTAAVVRENNRRCNQENVIEQLKNGVEALRMPSATLVANWAYLVIAAQAWNLKAWMGLVLPARLQARQLVKMEYRRFLREIIEMPCQILRTGRRLVYRLLDVNSWSRLLSEGSAWLKRRPAT